MTPVSVAMRHWKRNPMQNSMVAFTANLRRWIERPDAFKPGSLTPLRVVRARDGRLLAKPLVQFRAGLDVNAQEHHPVLRPAVLRALARGRRRSRAGRSTSCSVVGNQVRLASDRGTQKLSSVSAERKIPLSRRGEGREDVRGAQR